MATYEAGNAEGSPGRHAARGPGARPAARVRHHGGAASRKRRAVRPADRHHLPGPAPPGTGRPVVGTWSEAGGRRRRVYELTPAGHHTLDAERGTWRQFSAAVTALLEPAPRPVTS